MKDKLNGYALQKQFLDWAETTTKPVRHIHYALMWVAIELNNRLQWAEIFGLPTDSIMEKARINGRRHYYKALHELIEWGFITLHEKSRNQYASNRVSLNMLDTLSNKQPDLPGTLSNKQGYKQTILPGTLSNTQGSHNKTVKTIKEKTIKNHRGNKNIFIEKIIMQFQEVYPDYVIVTPGKEKDAAGKLLSVFKKQYPDYDSDEMLQKLRGHFELCKKIEDPWLKNNMSLPIMVSKYNEINRQINKKRKRREITIEDIRRFHQGLPIDEDYEGEEKF